MRWHSLTDIIFNLKMFLQYDLPGFFKRRRTSSIVFMMPKDFPKDNKYHNFTCSMNNVKCVGTEGLWNKHTYWKGEMKLSEE